MSSLFTETCTLQESPDVYLWPILYRVRLGFLPGILHGMLPPCPVQRTPREAIRHMGFNLDSAV